MSSDWNDPEINLGGLRLYHEQAKRGGVGAMSLQTFADVALEWAAKADAHIERIGRRREKKGRRELAEKILLKLVEMSPNVIFGWKDSGDGTVPDGEGSKLAWAIADAFLKHEGEKTS